MSGVENTMKNKLFALLEIVNDLERVFPERKFTLDGHLLGSIGEVMAEYYYGVNLYSSSNKLHDGFVDNKEVQIKITQNSSVDINGKPDYLLVFFLKKSEGKIYEVYNGPGDLVLKKAKKTKSGWYNRSFKVLNQYDSHVLEKDRIKAIRKIEKWDESIKN